MTELVSKVIDHIKTVTLKNLQLTADKLRLNPEIHRLNSEIRHGWRLEGNHGAMCFLSVFPQGKADEESIDIVFTFGTSGQKTHIDADIAWSTGQILGILLSLEANSDDGNFLEKIDLKIQEACARCEQLVVQALGEADQSRG